MENMLPGNSFPQICVVSVIESVGNKETMQGYKGSVGQGNMIYLLKSKQLPMSGLFSSIVHGAFRLTALCLTAIANSEARGN